MASCPRYAIEKNRPRDFAVWSVSPHTGSRREVVANFETKRAAQGYVRKKLNACDGLGRARRRR